MCSSLARHYRGSHMQRECASDVNKPSKHTRGSAQDMFGDQFTFCEAVPPHLHEVTIEDKEASKPQEYPSEDLNLEMTCVSSATHGMCCSLARHYRGSHTQRKCASDEQKPLKHTRTRDMTSSATSSLTTKRMLPCLHEVATANETATSKTQ